MPFTIHPRLAGVVANIGRSRAPPLRAVCCCRLPFIQLWRLLLPRCGPPGRRPLRRESIHACGQPAYYQSAAGVGGTHRSRPTERWRVFGGTGADRVVRPYEGICHRLPFVRRGWVSPPHPSRPLAVPPLAHVAASGSQARWAMATGPLPGFALALSAAGGASGTAPRGEG